MTEWQTIHGSQTEQPEEFDATSSSFFVYQRRNVKRINVEDTELWEYEERKLSREEYLLMINSQLNNELTDLQLAMCDLYESLGA